MNQYNLVKKLGADLSTQIENVKGFTDEHGNIYETINIISKRSNQVQTNLKEEFNGKKEEFITYTDSNEEFQENPELIEISRAYEQLPNAVNIAKKELASEKLLYKYPEEQIIPVSDDTSQEVDAKE